MAATGFTPIQLYHSTTASAAPTAADLLQGELAINIVDGKLYYEDGGGSVQVIATKDAAAGTFAQVNITGQGQLRLQDTAGGEYVALRAPGTLSASYTLTFPGDDGTPNQVLTTDGSGVLSWTTPATQVYPGAGIAVSTGSAWGTSLTAPTGTIVGTSDSQTLTNKTIALGSNTVSGTIAQFNTALTDGDFATLAGSETLTNKTLTDPAIIGTILEDIYTITDGAAFEVDPGNGSIQLITLTASRTPKATNFTNGEAITMMIDDGSAYTITWTDATWGGSGVVWKTDGGSAPTLNTTGYTAIVLWKVGGQVYGARVGNN